MALRFLDSDESHYSCLKCSEEEQEERRCVPTDEILEEESEETGDYLYWSEEYGKKMGGSFPHPYEDIYCYVCPRAVIKDKTNELMSLYNLCKQLNCLPDDGALNDQLATNVEAFTLIAGETYRLQEKRRKKNEQ